MKPRQRLLIFDIDGTLIRTGGAGRAAMNAAFASVLGIEDATEGIDLGGRTDLGIAREVLRRENRPWNRDDVEKVFATYLKHLEPAVRNAPNYEIMPGVPSLLERLAPLPNVALGLGTGNIEGGARVKLRRGDLDRPFMFGGFGSDAEDRVELLSIAATRGAALAGIPRAECIPIIIGDTPRDIQAAKGLGAPCIAVATGSFSREALREHEPEALLDGLDDPSAFDLLLTLS